jgi:uncharacterized protein DUF1488
LAEEAAMPLTTTGEPGFITDNICFWMLSETGERQRCAVTLMALEKLRAGPKLGKAEQIRYFNASRVGIERAASKKFDKRYFEAGGTVMVKAEDL